MSSHDLSRRRFLQTVSAATLAAGASVGAASYGGGASAANTLAALGGTAVRKKSFSAWPQVTAEMEQSLLAALRSRRWGRTLKGPMQGEGLVTEFEKQFARLVGAEYCLATGSCTQALHTSLHALGIAAGDEVLVPPCTYIATPQSILLCNALPVFVDVDLDTFQMDPDQIDPLVTENTRGMMPVHIAGLPCDMDRIMSAANRHGLKVVEDAAQAHLAEYRGKLCGMFGELGCFSFQSSKALACGEGGAIVGRDRDLLDQCYVFHNLGMLTTPGGAGIGTKYRMHELEAAVLLPQLATLRQEIQTRHDNACYLARRLEQIPGIVPQKLYEGVTRGAWYLFGFRYLQEHFNDIPRNVFLKALRAEGIPSTTMYFDRLNTQPFLTNALNSRTFQKIFPPAQLKNYWERNQCPVNDRLAVEGVWLPQYVFLGDRRDMDDIAEAMAKIQSNRTQLAKLP